MKNSTTHYGYLTILLHWLVAIIVFGMFALGFWMVDLTYYDAWYKSGPALHKSIGICLLMIMLFRGFWRLRQTSPEVLPTHTKFEKKAGHSVHILLYGLLFFIMISGYLISTADDRGIDVFNLFTVPGFGAFIENQEDVAGVIHQYLAYSMMGLVFLHATAALKHHFADKDITLKRMLGLRSK